MTSILSKDSEKELQLSQLTIENLPEAVFWITAQGKIFHVNDMAGKMTGYSREELSNLYIFDLNPLRKATEFQKFWKRLKKEKKFTFEAQHKHKAGHLFDVEIIGSFIEYDGQELACSIVRDIRKRKFEEHLLRTVSEAVSGL